MMRQMLLLCVHRDAVLFLFVIYICVFFFADPLAGIFNSEKNQQLQQIAVEGLRIYFPGDSHCGDEYHFIHVFYFRRKGSARPDDLPCLEWLIVIIPVTFCCPGLRGYAGYGLRFQ